MELLSKIFQISLMGSITAAVILLVKEIFNNQLGAKAHYYIWIFLLIRLLVPCLPDSPVSLFNITPMVQQEINLTELAGKENNDGISVSKLNQSTIANKSQESSQSTTNQTDSHQIKTMNQKNTIKTKNHISSGLFALWLTGSLLLGGIIIKRNINFWLQIKKLTPLDNPQVNQILANCQQTMNIDSELAVIETKLVTTPTLYGIINPKILLPQTMREEVPAKKLKNIFLHELAHLKRKDILINCLTIILQIIHWFNPLLWYAFYRLKKDQEVATDNLALSYLPAEKTNDYGQTIIDLLESFSNQPKIEGLIGFLDPKTQIKRRLRMINSFKQSSKKVSILVLVLFVLLGSISLTNAQAVNTSQSKQLPEKILLRVEPDGIYSNSENTAVTINSQTITEYYQQSSSSKTKSAKIKLPKGKPIFLTALDKGTKLTIDSYKKKQKLTVTIQHDNGLATSYQLPFPSSKTNYRTYAHNAPADNKKADNKKREYMGIVRMYDNGSTFLLSSNKPNIKHKQKRIRSIVKEEITKGEKFIKIAYPQNSDFTPYLRFKTVKNGKVINPLPYLN